MDDFIYSEPGLAAVPEPGTLLSGLAGIVLLAVARIVDDAPDVPLLDITPRFA
jgi:hypothetical protein